VVARTQRNATDTLFPRRRRSARTTRRLLLAVLLAAGLGLVTLSMRGDQLDGPRKAALTVLVPVEHVLTRVWAPVASGWDWVSDLSRATSENPRLQRRIDLLEQHQAAAKLAERDNENLRDLLAMQERGRFPDGYNQVAASVVSRSVNDTVVVDVGSARGVHVNDPVMVARGLVGRVDAVTRNAAHVSLIVNRTEALSAAIVEADATGVMRAVVGDGSPVFELSYVRQSVAVHKDDEVVTSGWASDDLRSVFPRGIPIGYVSSVGGNEADLYTSIQITPWADFDRIDHVFVLTRKPGTPAPIDPETLAKLRRAAGSVAGTVASGNGGSLSRAAVAAANKAARTAAARAEAKARARQEKAQQQRSKAARAKPSKDEGTA
jgi:rod shape-determining protein MreC